jgi:hypothetical protein
LLETEIEERDRKAVERRIKEAHFPEGEDAGGIRLPVRTQPSSGVGMEPKRGRIICKIRPKGGIKISSGFCETQALGQRILSLADRDCNATR